MKALDGKIGVFVKMVGKNLKKINETIDKFFENCIYKISDNRPKLLNL